MKKLDYATTAEDFVVMLSQWRRLWRRNTRGNHAARRHAKNMARKHIRLFKRTRGLAELPRLHFAFTTQDMWNAARTDEVKLVFPPRVNGGQDGVGSSRQARKDLKRIFKKSIEKNSSRHIDLINSGGAATKRLPSLADAAIGHTRAVRGLFLEAVGAAILPHLSPRDVRELEANGATVLDNEIIAVVDPIGENGISKITSPSWHLQTIEAKVAHDNGLRGSGVLIGILDTGIDASHPEFANKTIHYQAFDTTGNPRRLPAAKDFGKHGTHVAAICAGASAGVAPEADLAVAAVLTQRNDLGQMCGFLLQIAAGINWLATHVGRGASGVDIINASLGGSSDDTEDYYQTILGHRLQGKLMIAAIGNAGRHGMGTHGVPGRFDCVLAVGASDLNDNVADFSAWGTTFMGDQPLAHYKPDLVAPGVHIYSAVPGAGYEEMSGTSMACPVVSGAAELLIQKDASLRRDPDKLTARLLSLTRSLPGGPHNSDHRRYGRGRLHLADI